MQNEDVMSPTHDEVMHQCSLILKDTEFKRSAKLSRFLRYIVEQTLANNSHYLKAYTIAIEVFEKDETFDPQTDPLIRVNAVRLRRMLKNYYHKFPDENIHIYVPKGCYIPSFAYFNQSNTAQLKSKLEIPHGCSFPSVAVLYFQNISHKQEYSLLADGFTQELLAEFTKFKSITFISSSTQNQQSNRTQDAHDQSSIEDAQYVVSGSLLVVDDNVQVYAEVIDSITQTLIWSKTYLADMNVQKIIDIKNQIAMSIATSVAQPYGLIVRNKFVEMNHKSTHDYSAYELSLNYYQWMMTLSVKDHHHAYVSVTKALDIDPDFSDAWASLAILYVADFMFSYKSIDINEDVRDLGLQAAKQALKSDPENSRAHYALFYVNISKYGVRAYLDQAEQAYQLNKNNTSILADYGIRLAVCGYWDQGVELIQVAMTLNPAHPDFYHGSFIMNNIRLGDYQEALRHSKLMNMPDYFWTHIHLIVVHSKLNDLENAINSAYQLIKLYPDINKQVENEFKKWDVDEMVSEIYLHEFNKIMSLLSKPELSIIS